MAERLLMRARAGQPLAPAPDEPWWEWLAARTRATYETLIAHRDGPRVAAGNRPTAAALPAIEVSIATLVDAGFEPADALEVFLTMTAFTVGCALEWQAERDRSQDAAHDPDLRDAVLSGRYPALQQAFTEHRKRHEASTPHGEMFELGLSLLIDGLRHRVTSTSRELSERA
jgi:TetR/AcrR family tetracycline transcriptional repressor